MYRWNLCFVGICWRAHHLPYGSPGMPARAVVLWHSWDDGDLLFYLLLLLHKKPELAPWLLFTPLALGHLKLAYRWWREPIPFIGDSLWVCRIGLGVSSESTDSMKEGLRCFAQGCLWRRSRMKTWSPSYRCARFSSCRLAQGACTKIVPSCFGYNIFYFVLCFRCMEMILYCNEFCTW
jgi:hypothetical protein